MDHPCEVTCPSVESDHLQLHPVWVMVLSDVLLDLFSIDLLSVL